MKGAEVLWTRSPVSEMLPVCSSWPLVLHLQLNIQWIYYFAFNRSSWLFQGILFIEVWHIWRSAQTMNFYKVNSCNETQITKSHTRNLDTSSGSFLSPLCPRGSRSWLLLKAWISIAHFGTTGDILFTPSSFHSTICVWELIHTIEAILTCSKN